MKNKIYTLVIATLIAGTTLSGCQSSVQKEAAAEGKVQDAKENLLEAEKNAAIDAQKVASEAEWKAFKGESELKIRNNEIKIADLKMKMKKSGKKLDAIYEKRIDTLEDQNKDLEKRVDNYENNRSDWAAFKREFNHDMDELGAALKDLTVDNKK